MKRLRTFALIALAATAVIGADIASAARMGGGRSSGAQRQMTPSTPSAAPAAPSAPMQSAIPARPAAPAAAAPSGMSRWLGPIAGIAAGLGLAALLSHFGMPEGMGSFLLLALLGIGVVFVVRAFLARRSTSNPRQPIQFAGAGAGLGSTPGGYETQAPRQAAGVDGKFEPVLASNWSQPTGSPAPAGQFPPGFDAAGFAEQAKSQFRRLQAAYDTNDRRALAEVMTPGMYAEIGKEIDSRGRHTATAIDRLDAQVRNVTTEGDRHWASVHFNGSLREDGATLPSEFEEVWNLSKPVDGSSGWLLAGIQQLGPVSTDAVA